MTALFSDGSPECHCNPRTGWVVTWKEAGIPGKERGWGMCRCCGSATGGQGGAVGRFLLQRVGRQEWYRIWDPWILYCIVGSLGEKVEGVTYRSSLQHSLLPCWVCLWEAGREGYKWQLCDCGSLWQPQLCKQVVSPSHSVPSLFWTVAE